MLEINTYERYLLMASQGNPIKLAVLLNHDLHQKHPDAYTLMAEKGYDDFTVDNVLNIAEYLVNTKTV